ncbi:unnamed protein product, partial [Amoebophrya sp. A120]|eukprot:GSA120T00024501001.1
MKLLGPRGAAAGLRAFGSGGEVDRLPKGPGTSEHAAPVVARAAAGSVSEALTLQALQARFSQAMPARLDSTRPRRARSKLKALDGEPPAQERRRRVLHRGTGAARIGDHAE